MFDKKEFKICKKKLNTRNYKKKMFTASQKIIIH